jgi:hypothetical protein
VRCPACRADNTTGPQCRRCRADLSLLFALEDQRLRVLEQAALAARRGDWREVTRLAGQAHDLRRDEDSRRLLALAHLVQRHFAEAWQVYNSGTSLSASPGR